MAQIINTSTPSTRLKVTRGPRVGGCSYTTPLRSKSMYSEFPRQGLKLCNKQKKKGKVQEKRASTTTRLLLFSMELTGEKEESAAAKHEGVAVFVVKDGRKVLLGRRITFVCNDTFGPPGGHLEFGESFEECVVREIKEETGLDIEKIEFLTAVTKDFSEEQSKPCVHLFCVFVRATLVDPQQVARNLEPKKCVGWDWYDWDDLPEPLFEPLKTMVQGGFSPF